MDYIYIDSDQKLVDFCALISAAEYCVVDTEFVREKTYYPELALIQVASGQHMGCVDPLVIGDFEPLIKLMRQVDLVKVFHSSSQDLEILFQAFGIVPAPLFDTQLAAAVLGYSHQISYADLVFNITKVQLEKKHTRANWIRRPLSPDELDYAMDDVRYLMPVYHHLKSELEAKNRSAWIDKELLTMTDESTYKVDTFSLWKRLKGVQKLKGIQLQIASLLSQWRETLAQNKNLPKRWVVKDELIIDIARHKPGTVADLAAIRDASDKFVEQHAKTVIELVEKAQTIDPGDWPRHDTVRVITSGQQAIGDCLMAMCRGIAERNNIALASLATRKDIDSLILNRKNSQLAQGWRFEMAGEQLLDFIYGQSLIGVRDGELVAINQSQLLNQKT
jgi:ribonuclease D